MSKETFKNFKEHSVAEFFKKNRQMLGLYGKIRSLTTIIHEFATNSIDACEEANILPAIEVKIIELKPEYYEVHVVDNGPGIPADKVGKALGKLLAGTKFHRLIQTRGQQGIGASGCVLFSQMTTGQPVRVITCTGNEKPVYVELTIDTQKNEPKILAKKELDIEFKGLGIKARYKDVLYKDGPQSPLEYLKRLAIANPHVQIKFQDPSGKTYNFERATEKMPKIPIEVKPHIKSITTDEFLQDVKAAKNTMVTAFMKDQYDRCGEKVIVDINKLLEFDLKALTKRMIDWKRAEQIVKAIQKVKTIAPRTDAIIPIEEEYLKKSIVNVLKPESLSVVTRKPAVYRGGYPFQVEVSIAYGGDAGRTLKTNGNDKLEIMRFANRAPLLFDPGSCAISKAIQSIDWKRYNIKDLEHISLSIIVNISSVHIPYTSAGKQAIADEDEIMNEIRQAIMQAARSISLHISRKKQLKDKEERKKIFYLYGAEVADALSYLTTNKKEDIFNKLEKIITEKLRIEEIEEKMKKQKEKSGLTEIENETNEQTDPFETKEEKIIEEKHEIKKDKNTEITTNKKKTLGEYFDN
jgi:DNA topoisomerase VI subunit B